ncbi:MAG: MerR family transcriptional regulator [Acidimicrobiia bacterium]
MTTTTPSEHLSIGEVLATLRDEFPDITISKIRFLESQGLIDPERTPSGYRKFYGPDIDRLRWILHQQKENFLPLKVIKGRLEDAGPDDLPEADAPDEPEKKPAAKASGAKATGVKATGNKASGAKAASTSKTATKATATRASAKTAADKEASMSGASDKPAGSRSKSGAARPKSAVSKAKVRRPRSDMPKLALDDDVEDTLESSDDGSTMTRAELASASGLTNAQITELEEFGLLEPAGTGGEKLRYDDDALAVAMLAAGFAKHGIEARHLRMYRSFAEREATLYGQVIQGVLRQRNPEARARARADLVELAGLGRGLRSAFLRRAVDDLLTD